MAGGAIPVSMHKMTIKEKRWEVRYKGIVAIL